MDMNNTPEPRMPLVENLEFLDLMGVISSPCIICAVRIRRSAGEPRTRLTSANRRRPPYWPPDAMPRRYREFVDSRLRRSPPDRASAVPCGQAGENAMRFPHLAHRSATAHKLHSTPQQHAMNLISGNRETSSRLPALSLFFPGGCPNNRHRRKDPCVPPPRRGLIAIFNDRPGSPSVVFPTQSPTGSNGPRRLVQSSVLEEVAFARDSPLEGARFEPSVPRIGTTVSRAPRVEHLITLSPCHSYDC